MEQTTSNKIKYVSYVLAIFIVIRHTTNTPMYEGLSGAFAGIQHYIETFAVCMAIPLFFAISGYLFFTNYDPKRFYEKWKRRIFTLVIPYLVWNLLSYLAVFLPSCIPAVAANMSNPLTFSFPDFLKTLLYGEGECGALVTWFMRCLIIFAVLAPAFYYLLKNRYAGLVLLVALFAVGAFASYINGYFMYAAYYFLGSYFALNWKNAAEKRYSLPAKIISIVLALGAAALLAFAGKDLPRPVVNTVTICFIPFAWICGDILALPKKPPFWVGISFFIYVSHDIVLQVIKKLFLIGLGNNIFGSVLNYIISPIITVAILTGLAYLLQKIKPVWQVLTGNRK
ncbi:MAG: acyltransferase [Clostridia bacterium]|nr:acyltransferase [Clostridia bacterium]